MPKCVQYIPVDSGDAAKPFVCMYVVWPDTTRLSAAFFGASIVAHLTVKLFAEQEVLD